jgi:imidazolonepropionase-like amidohydrolase
MRLDAWNWEDAVLAPDVALHLHWPEMQAGRRLKEKEKKERQEKTEAALAGLQKLFDEAQAYSRIPVPRERNLNLEAMRGLFDGSRKLFIHARDVRQITAAMHFCDRYGLPFVLVGGEDAWRVADELKARGIPVVLDRTHALPMRRDEDVDIAYKTPALLRRAGVLFCTSVEGFWQVRNLSYNAGTNAAYGMTREEALESVTLSPARILGIGDRVGSLQEGKDATLVVTEGDLLDMRHSEVVLAFIEGRWIDLDNMQKDLYHKYRRKYGLE